MDTMNRTATKTPKIQIVLALTEQTLEAIPGTWTTSRGDGVNAVAKTQAVTIAKACMWMRRATVNDLPKAEAYAAQSGFSVFTFPTSERHPLEAAKALVLKGGR